MRRAGLTALAFLGGAVAGYAAALAAYIVLNAVFGVADREGAMAMAFAFLIGPVVGVVCGVVAAVATARSMRPEAR